MVIISRDAVLGS